MAFDLAESFIERLELELGARLPDSFRQSMMGENGGGLEAADDVWFQYPITDTSDRKRLSRTSNHIWKETLRYRDWNAFPKNGLAIADNGSGDCLLFLLQGDVYMPQVYMWLHETGELLELVGDFSELKPGYGQCT
ncbi:SMI1/KNR4 family protein [Chitinibacter sp. S2-10]|uniref:SMI1/KNR4 family protein n=1 Tax=Chitinibacter sp. S2-10 TaxID=3373597 RepID=UPI003977B067